MKFRNNNDVDHWIHVKVENEQYHELIESLALSNYLIEPNMYMSAIKMLNESDHYYYYLILLLRNFYASSICYFYIKYPKMSLFVYTGLLFLLIFLW
jgi:hypothetical protein